MRKKIYPIKIKFENGSQLYVATSTKKGRKNWACLLKGKFVQSSYMAQIKESKTRPDSRLINILYATVDLGSIRLDHAPISTFTVGALAQMVVSFEDLNIVTFTSSEFTDEHAQILSTSLPKANIRDLQLADNHLTSVGTKVIAEALSKNKSIESVDLSSNEIDDECADSLATFISKHKVTSLNFENNKFEGTGAKIIFEAISTHPNWSVLQFNGNKLGDEGIESVAFLVNKNPSISELQLARNLISDAGVKLLCDSLKNNNSVTHIDLSGNLLTQLSVSYIDQLLHENKTIKQINLSENAQILGGSGLENVFSNEAFSLSGLTLTRTMLN